jgi:hypothetical protein
MTMTFKIKQFALTFVLCAQVLVVIIATETTRTLRGSTHVSDELLLPVDNIGHYKHRTNTTAMNNDNDIILVSSNITRSHFSYNTSYSVQQQQRRRQRQNVESQPKQGQQRRLGWGWDEVPCGITGFSLYNKRSNLWDPILSVFIDGTYQSLVLLDKYEDGKINIQVHVSTDGCPDLNIECVRIKLGNFADKTEGTYPYTLYSWRPSSEYTERPEQIGLQSLQAWAYESGDCSGEHMCYEQTDLLLIPDTSEAIELFPLTAVYVDTDDLSPPLADTLELVSATCDYITNALQHPDPNYYFFHINGSLQYDKNPGTYTCNFSVQDYVVPIHMTYYITTTYTYTHEISLYSNPLFMPAQADISDYIKGLFRNTYGNTLTGETMEQYVKRTIDPSNVYYKYTSIDAYDVPN